jgi:hypothetical protein
MSILSIIWLWIWTTLKCVLVFGGVCFFFTFPVGLAKEVGNLERGVVRTHEMISKEQNQDFLLCFGLALIPSIPLGMLATAVEISDQRYMNSLQPKRKKYRKEKEP